jgi:hypothetical protein
MSDKYILGENGELVPCNDLMEWAREFDNTRRQVAGETIGESLISTVFLGLDHSFGGAVPILWETMVFGGRLDQEQDRCSGCRADAQAMHDRMVDRVKSTT